MANMVVDLLNYQFYKKNPEGSNGDGTGNNGVIGIADISNIQVGDTQIKLGSWSVTDSRTHFDHQWDMELQNKMLASDNDFTANISCVDTIKRSDSSVILCKNNLTVRRSICKVLSGIKSLYLTIVMSVVSSHGGSCSSSGITIKNLFIKVKFFLTALKKYFSASNECCRLSLK